MRVTTQLMTESMKNHLLSQTERMLKKQEIISTTKRINRPSDDPIGAASVLYHKRLLSSIDQYDRNIQVGKNRMEFTETTLETVEDLISEGRNWAINQASATVTDRDNAYFQVERIRDQMLQLANSKLGDNYIFGGHQTDAPPFDVDGNYQGDDGKHSVIIGDKREMSMEADGSRIFHGTSGTADVFDIMNQLLTGIQNGEVTLIQSQVDRLTEAREQIQNIRAENAASYKHMEMTESQLARFHLSVENIISRTEDADLNEAIIDLKNQEVAYQAALETAARIVQPTLMNFLG
ncbi:MAG: flagellar hook-associated protein FlgL [Desulfobacterales bacterium]